MQSELKGPLQVEQAPLQGRHIRGPKPGYEPAAHAQMPRDKLKSPGQLEQSLASGPVQRRQDEWHGPKYRQLIGSMNIKS